MEVRPERAPETTALEPGLAVVSEPMDDATERLGAGVEQRPPGVVLEAGQEAHVPGLELALEQDIADHPRFACDRLVREETDALHPRAGDN